MVKLAYEQSIDDIHKDIIEQLCSKGISDKDSIEVHYPVSSIVSKEFIRELGLITKNYSLIEGLKIVNNSQFRILYDWPRSRIAYAHIVRNTEKKIILSASSEIMELINRIV